MSTRLKFAVIGLGQCGNNLANTFAKYGYPAIALNTSILDLKDLGHIPENRKIHIPLKDSDGAGKDPRIGEQAIHQHISTVLSGVEEFVQGADAILLTAGLGGGTGSNIPVLGGILKRFNLPIVALVTIPTANEAALAKINALKGVNKILAENFNSCILIDNDKILPLFPEGSLAAFYPQANEYVVKTFTSFNSISTELQSRCLISFDNEDFRKVLLSQGILIFGENELKAREVTNLDEILPNLRHIWETSGLMAEGFDYNTASSGAICIYAPSSVLQKTSSKFLNHLGEAFKGLTKGATCYFGLYEVPNSDTIRISTMLGRLAIPARLKDMLAEASNEGLSLSRKMKEELPQLDISSLDAVDLLGFDPPSKKSPSTALSASDTHILRREEIAVAPGVPEIYPGMAGDGEAGPALEGKSYSVEEYVKLKKAKGA